MIGVVTIAIGVVEVITAIEWIDAYVCHVPHARVAGLPSVGKRVTVRIRVVRVDLRPVLCSLGTLTVARKSVHSCIEQKEFPLVFTVIRKPIAVRVLVAVGRVHRVQGPFIAAVEGGADPAPVLDLPTIGHAVSVTVPHGGVGRSVGGSRGACALPPERVDLRGDLAFGIVAEVLTGLVVTGEVGLGEEPAPVLRAVEQAVTVGVGYTRVRAVEAFGNDRQIAELIEIGPVVVEDVIHVGVEIDAIDVEVLVPVVRVGRVETVRVLPTVRHPVEVRIVVERIDQHAVGVASRVEAGEHGLVAVHVHHGEFGDDPRYAGMSGVHTERTGVVTVEHPCAEHGTYQHLVAQRQDGVHVVGTLGVPFIVLHPLAGEGDQRVGGVKK